MRHPSPCHFCEDVSENESVMSVWLKRCNDSWSVYTEQRDGRHSYLALAVQLLGKANGAQFSDFFLFNFFLIAHWMFSCPSVKTLLKSCVLPSSSDTSRISSTVSGKLMRCFSVIDWKADNWIWKKKKLLKLGCFHSYFFAEVHYTSNDFVCASWRKKAN